MRTGLLYTYEFDMHILEVSFRNKTDTKTNVVQRVDGPELGGPYWIGRGMKVSH